MALTRLYLATDEMADWQPQQSIHLPKTATHHIVNVLRKTPGDAIQLFDGQGHEWHAVLTTCSKKSASAELINAIPTLQESPITTHMGIALFRGDRFDFAIQKAVELGVNAITPLLTDHVSMKQNQAHLEKRLQHWQNIIISACEQSRRGWIPQLHSITPFAAWVDAVQGERHYILHPPQAIPEQTSDTNPINSTANSKTETQQDVVFVSGPEGGLSEGEFLLAQSKGFQAVSLGSRILRAETAPLAFLAILQAQFGDFQTELAL